MGTRHLTIVVSNDQYKVAQYGQWDGYPTGQGKTVTQFIIDNLRQQDGFDSFKKKIDACKFISHEDLQEKMKDYPQYVTFEQKKELDAKFSAFSKNTCAKILDVINNSVESVELQNSIDFANDSLFCEWAWVVNLDNKTLEVFEGFNKSPLDVNERFYKPQFDSDGYFPIKLLKIYSFDELTATSMQELEDECRGNDEE